MIVNLKKKGRKAKALCPLLDIDILLNVFPFAHRTVKNAVQFAHISAEQTREDRAGFLSAANREAVDGLHTVVLLFLFS